MYFSVQQKRGGICAFGHLSESGSRTDDWNYRADWCSKIDSRTADSAPVRGDKGLCVCRRRAGAGISAGASAGCDRYGAAENTLFSGTVRDNLRWGKEDATQEEIDEACRIACVDEFIDRLDNGYDTELGQGGVNVSGGQKQRLCIARAILKQPKVLILDDSTSAVDTATEAKIREGLKAKLPEMTKIIIAQRISSVRSADQIVILDDGKINAVGTHEQLLAENRIYQEIYHSQQEGGAL